jgi:predicted DsbA family dithiol-disulfide isomerase
MNVNYVIVTLPLILYSDYVCNVCMMGEALLSDMMKIHITELVE